jgi:hypothetical protein
MVFNATFNNISAISRWSVLLVEETGVPAENHRNIYIYIYYLMIIAGIGQSAMVIAVLALG